MAVKIVCIGAGSASFGLSTLVTLLRSKVLQGSQLWLVDLNADVLEMVHQGAEWFNQAWQSQMEIHTTTNHRQALPGADFVISAIEVPPREALWRKDYEITLKHGLRQPYAENGGPGGFAHAVRNVAPVLQIVRDMEELCPQAWFLNFTNPMQRICALISRHSTIKVAGFCHQLGAGYAMVAKAFGVDWQLDAAKQFRSTHAAYENFEPMHACGMTAYQRVRILAAGINHFTWMLALHDRQSGEDLYPAFRKNWQALDPTFEPLTRKVFAAFGLFPIPGDEHLCEYLPWVSNALTKPWQKYDLSLYDWDERAQGRDDARNAFAEALQKQENPDQYADVQSEGAVEFIENIITDGHLIWEALNIPNRGYIDNLPEGAIVELPAVISARGAVGLPVGSLPQGIAGLLHREITASHLCVDSVVTGDRQMALQCLLLDPMITDLDMAESILKDYLDTYKQYLPTFWG